MTENLYKKAAEENLKKSLEKLLKAGYTIDEIFKYDITEEEMIKFSEILEKP